MISFSTSAVKAQAELESRDDAIFFFIPGPPAGFLSLIVIEPFGECAVLKYHQAS